MTANSNLTVETAIRLGRFVEAMCFSKGKKSPSVFECLSPPPISDYDYFVRLGQFMRCSESSFVIAGVLVQRLYETDPSIFAELAVLKLVSTSLVIAIKIHEDSYFSNPYYAECAGVTLEDLNGLESTFLGMLDFRVFVTLHDYEIMKSKLQNLEKVFSAMLQQQQQQQQQQLQQQQQQQSPVLIAYANPMNLISFHDPIVGV